MFLGYSESLTRGPLEKSLWNFFSSIYGLSNEKLKTATYTSSNGFLKKKSLTWIRLILQVQKRVFMYIYRRFLVSILTAKAYQSNYNRNQFSSISQIMKWCVTKWLPTACVTSEVTNETRKSTQSLNIYVTKIRQSRDITKDKSDFTQLAMNQMSMWHGYHKLGSFTWESGHWW